MYVYMCVYILLYNKFIPNYLATVGVDFGVRTVTVNKQEVRVNFWDLSGHPEFFEVRNEFYRSTQAVCMCVCVYVCMFVCVCMCVVFVC